MLKSCEFCTAVMLGDVRSNLKLDGLGKATARKLDVKRAAGQQPSPG